MVGFHLFHWITQQIPPYAQGLSEYARPRSSTQGIPGNVGLAITGAALIFAVYVIYQVNKGLKTRGKKQGSKRNKKNKRGS